MSKLFQISEDDLATLERVVPEFVNAIMVRGGGFENKLCVKVRQVKQILSDVRWKYTPPSENETILAGSDT